MKAQFEIAAITANPNNESKIKNALKRAVRQMENEQKIQKQCIAGPKAIWAIFNQL